MVFYADRAQLEKINIMVIVGDFEGVGHEIHPKEFVDAAKIPVP